MAKLIPFFETIQPIADADAAKITESERDKTLGYVKNGLSKPDPLTIAYAKACIDYVTQGKSKETDGLARLTNAQTALGGRKSNMLHRAIPVETINAAVVKHVKYLLKMKGIAEGTKNNEAATVETQPASVAPTAQKTVTSQSGSSDSTFGDMIVPPADTTSEPLTQADVAQIKRDVLAALGNVRLVRIFNTRAAGPDDHAKGIVTAIDAYVDASLQAKCDQQKVPPEAGKALVDAYGASPRYKSVNGALLPERVQLAGELLALVEKTTATVFVQFTPAQEIPVKSSNDSFTDMIAAEFAQAAANRSGGRHA